MAGKDATVWYYKAGSDKKIALHWATAGTSFSPVSDVFETQR
jgi:hypothetical protein